MDAPFLAGETHALKLDARLGIFKAAFSATNLARHSFENQ
jgi:hypothetical protein